MKIRLLEAADAESYWELRLEALKQNPEAFSSSYEEAVQRRNPVEQVAKNFSAEGNYTFGAFEGGELIGMVTLLQEMSLKLRHRANIFAMYVTPKNQRKGTGKALLTKAINQARSIEGIEKLNLTVNSSNVKAKSLYTSLGFEVSGVEEKAIKVNNVYYGDEHMVLFLNRLC